MSLARRSTKAREATFTVKWPYGASYCNQLKLALRRLGLVIGESPFIGGSDAYGFLVAPDRTALTKARSTIRDSHAAEPDPDDYAFDALLETLKTLGVYEVMQDWKHLDWQADVSRLRRLGVTLKHMRGRDKKATRRMAFTVSRSKNRS